MLMLTFYNGCLFVSLVLVSIQHIYYNLLLCLNHLQCNDMKYHYKYDQGREKSAFQKRIPILIFGFRDTCHVGPKIDTFCKVTKYALKLVLEVPLACHWARIGARGEP